MKEIYLAGGCFWGVEKYLSNIKGVVETSVGYANGETENPTYEDVCRKNTRHAETVKLIYDETIVDLDRILSKFYKIINPTSKDKQGNDIGKQYRTGIYYTDISDLETIQKSIEELQKNYEKRIVIEVEELKQYFLAEEYHQKYLDKNPNGYCHISIDKMEEANNTMDKKYLNKSKEELREELTDIQYKVTQENGTEPPFKNEYYDNFHEGIYVDITTGEPLFISTDKFDSGCGWPSFSRPINYEVIKEKTDLSHGMIRTEVRNKTGDSHLGHVFNDGPQEKGGFRYCINSASLKFIKKQDMKREGYEEYLYLLESRGSSKEIGKIGIKE